MTDETARADKPKDPWAQLAESLGLAPKEESPGSEKASSASEEVMSSPAEVAGSSADAEPAAVSQVETPPGEGPKTAIPDRIRLRSWSRRTQSGGNWEAIASQLGVRPAEQAGQKAGETPRGSESESLSPLVQEVAEESAAGVQSLVDVLRPAEEMIVPPPLEDASLVAVTVPAERDEREVVQTDVSPPGDWLDEQVAAVVEPQAREDLQPVVAEILRSAPESEALAADTLTLAEGDVQPGVSGGPETAAVTEKKKRRRRRKKKRSASTPISPEPFEEELSEIVELATKQAGNGEEEEAEAATDVVETSHRDTEEVAVASYADKARHMPADDGSEEGAEVDEHDDIPRPSHKAVPGWAEVVGYVIQKNMEARSRKPSYNPRDRRR